MTGLHIDPSARQAEKRVLTDCCNAEPVVSRTVSDLMSHWPQDLDENGALIVGEGHHKQCLDSGDFDVTCPACGCTIDTEVEEQ